MKTDKRRPGANPCHTPTIQETLPGKEVKNKQSRTVREYKDSVSGGGCG